MNTSFIIIFVLTVITAIVAYRLDKFWEGVNATGDMFHNILPMLLLAFVFAGMMQALIPKEFITKLLGKDTGLKGIILGGIVGVVLPGGPMTSFPILAVFYKGGASMGAIVAMLSSWGLLGIFRFIAFEVPILGTHFALSRFVITLIFPVIIGYVAEVIFGK